MKRAISLLLVVLATASVLSIRPKLAVYGFISSTFSRRELAGLNGVLESELTNLGYFRILTREDIKLIFKERNLGEMGMVEPEEMGKLVGARFVAFGRIDETFGKYGYVTVTVKIVDIATGEVVFSNSLDVPRKDASKAVRLIVRSIGFDGRRLYRKRIEVVEKEMKREEREEGWFLSGGVYYIHSVTEDLAFIPLVRIGTRKNDVAYGVNLLLGGFYRKYWGILYGEIGTLLIFVPYVEVGVKFGFLEASLFDFVFPGVSLTFTF